MGDIDRFSPVPAYRQIADVLRGQIASGAVSHGEKLPSERELCERYDVDRGVVRRALALLQASGLVVTSTGGERSSVSSHRFDEWPATGRSQREDDAGVGSTPTSRTQASRRTCPQRSAGNSFRGSLPPEPVLDCQTK
jgi:GntR family transcriptional regulator